MNLPKFPINIDPTKVILPGVKDSLNTDIADVKKVAEATWAQAQQTSISMKNQMINRSPVSMEQLNVVVDNVSDQAKEFVEKKVDNYIYSETGYHLDELQGMLSTGNQIFNVMKTMAQTNQSPNPEWIVDTINTMSKMLGKYNPRIEELRAEINAKWDMYKDFKNKVDYAQNLAGNATTWLKEQAARGRNMVEEEEKREKNQQVEETKQQSTDEQQPSGTLGISSDPTQTETTLPSDQSTPTLGSSPEVQASQASTPTKRMDLRVFYQNMYKLTDSDVIHPLRNIIMDRFNKNSEINKNTWTSFDDFIKYLVQGLILIYNYNCTDINTALEGYNKLSGTKTVNHWEKFPPFQDEWLNLFNIFLYNLIGDEVDQWNISKDSSPYPIIELTGSITGASTSFITSIENVSFVSGGETTDEANAAGYVLDEVVVVGQAPSRADASNNSTNTGTQNNGEEPNVLLNEVVVVGQGKKQPTSLETFNNSLNAKLAGVQVGNGVNVSNITVNKGTDYPVIDTLKNSAEGITSAGSGAVQNVKNSAVEAGKAVQNTAVETAKDLYKKSTGVYNTIENYAKGVGKNAIMDSSAYINNLVADSKSMWNTYQQNFEEYKNMFNNPEELKKKMDEMLKAWLSSLSQSLCNAFMVTKFKEIIEDIKKTAREGFKKGTEGFEKIDAAITIFEDIQKLIYTAESIETTDNLKDIVKVDTTKYEDMYNSAKKTVKDSIATVKTSVKNTIDTVMSQKDVFKNSMNTITSQFKSSLGNLKNDISVINENLMHFGENQVINAIHDVVENIIPEIADAIGADALSLKSNLNLDLLTNNIQSDFVDKVKSIIESDNKDVLSTIKNSASTLLGVDTNNITNLLTPGASNTTNTSSTENDSEEDTGEDEETSEPTTAEEEIEQEQKQLGKSVDFNEEIKLLGDIGLSVDLKINVDIDQIFQDTVMSNFQSSIEMVENKITWLSDQAQEIFKSGQVLLTDSISTIAEDVDKIASDVEANAKNLVDTLDSTRQQVTDNVSAISDQILTSMRGLSKLSEKVMSLDELMPDVAIKAPSFIKIFLNWLKTLQPVLKLLSKLIGNYRTNKAMTREAALAKITQKGFLKKLGEGFIIWEGIVNGTEPGETDAAELKEVTDEEDADFIKHNIANRNDCVEQIDGGKIVLTEHGTTLLNEYYNEKEKFKEVTDTDKKTVVLLNDDGRYEVEQDSITGQIIIKDTEETPPATASEVIDNANNCEEVPFIEEEGTTNDEITEEMMDPDFGIEDIEPDDPYIETDDPDVLAMQEEYRQEQEELDALDRIKQFREYLKIESDEMEGQQVVDFKALDICNNNNLMSLYDPRMPKPGYPFEFTPEPIIPPTPAIIEFARETIYNEGVDFQLLVKPGEQIQKDQSIAIISKHGEEAVIKSIFTKGKVRLSNITEDGYAHAYDSSRNIIIDNVELALDETYEEELNNIMESFNEENELYDLITNYMIDSIYPDILLSTSTDPTNPLTGNKPQDAFDKVIEGYKETSENFCEDMTGYKKMDKKTAKKAGDNFATKIREVKGNSNKIQEISDDTLNKRKDFILGDHSAIKKRNGIVDLYKNYKKFYPQARLISDDSGESFKNLGVTYYINLYADVDDVNLTGQWVQRYKKLLKDILNKRVAYEKVTFTDLINILNYEALEASEENRLENIPKNDFYSYLQDYYEEVIPTYDEFYDYVYDKLAEDSSEKFLMKLYNIYNYIKLFDENKITNESANNEVDFNDLLNKENTELKKFWEEATERYKEVEASKQVNDLKEEKERIAPWPAKMPITLQGNRRSYDLYLFKNIFDEEEPELPDDDMSEELDTPGDFESFTPDTAEAMDDFYNIDISEEEVTIDVDNIKYWRRWCSQATLANCVMGPQAWSTGMIINNLYVQFPAILTPLKVINIKPINLIIVIGLAIRLVDVKLMVIYVNPNNAASSVNTLLASAIERVKGEYDKYMSYIENVNINAIQILINKLESDNAELLKANTELQITLDEEGSLLPEGWADAKKLMNEMVGGMDIFQNVYRIKNYPKLSDFNTNLHLSIGEGSIFGEREFDIDFQSLFDTNKIKDEIQTVENEIQQIEEEATSKTQLSEELKEPPRETESMKLNDNLTEPEIGSNKALETVTNFLNQNIIPNPGNNFLVK